MLIKGAACLVSVAVVTFPSCARHQSERLACIGVVPPRFKSVFEVFPHRTNQELILAAALAGRHVVKILLCGAVCVFVSTSA